MLFFASYNSMCMQKHNPATPYIDEVLIRIFDSGIFK